MTVLEFLQQPYHLSLAAVAVVSGAMLLWPVLRRGAGGSWLTTLEATQLMNREDAVVIDVRDAAEFAKGHILGAKSVPLADLARRAEEFEKYKKRPLIVHCENGNRAGGAVSILRQRGFEKVHNLAGGFAAWQQAGLPVKK